MKKLFVLLAAMLTFTSTAFAQIGSLSSDLVYTPVTPCRVLDTRPSQGGPGSIPAGGTISYYVGNLSSFAGQGGAASNCGIPNTLNVAAVSVNFTVVTPAAGGYITVFPYLAAKPTAATVNFVAGDIVGNSAIVKVNQTAATAVSIYTTSTTDVVADVTGYYSKPVATALDCSYQAYESFSLPVNFSGYHYTTSICPATYTPTSSYCYNQNNPDIYATGSGVNGGAWCGWRNLSGVAASVSQNVLCCRIPGR
jgi:hypothetical protein